MSRHVLGSGRLSRSKAAGNLLFAIIPVLFAAAILYNLRQTDSPPTLSTTLSAPNGTLEIRCEDVSSATDTCLFVQQYCPEYDADGLIPYLRLFYCAPEPARPYLLVGMFIWLMILFASMAAAAGDFLSIHLAAMVAIIGISESLAGVTIFAFGNGSSDLFSTLAAMKSNSGGMAISELFGAAAFINTIVLASVMIICPLKVDPKTFVKDILWFVINASILIAFLADGRLVLGECLAIIGLYVAFICHSLLGPRGINLPGTSEADETTRLLENDEVLPAEDSLVSTSSHIDSSDHAVSSQLAQFAAEMVHEARPGFRSMFPSLRTWTDQTFGERIPTLFSIPFLLPIGLTTVLVDSHDPNLQLCADADSSSTSSFRWLQAVLHNPPLMVQLVLGPQLLGIVLISQMDFSFQSLRLVCPLMLLVSTAFIMVNIYKLQSRYDCLLNSLLGFIISLVWIYLTATSAVCLLKALGLILRLPEVLLGATIFAVGNSSNDLAANTAVARRGLPMLAVSACFGGPMMNMLLGIGVGGLSQVVTVRSDSTRPAVYVFGVETALFVSAGTLLVALISTLIYAFCNRWRLDRPLGIALILMWAIGTTISVLTAIDHP